MNTTATVDAAVDIDAAAITIAEVIFDSSLDKFAEASNTLVFLNGETRVFTGTEEDLDFLVGDFNARAKQTLATLYGMGANLSRALEVFKDSYQNGEEVFFEMMTKRTGYSRSKLKNEMRIYESYSFEEVQLLLSRGVTQVMAIRAASKGKQKALVGECEQINGKISSEAIDDIAPQDARKKKTKSEKSSNESNRSSSNEKRHKNVPDGDCEEDEAEMRAFESFEYSIPGQTLTPLTKNDLAKDIEAKIQRLAQIAIDVAKDQIITSREGKQKRFIASQINAVLNDVPLPSTEATLEDQEDWIKEIQSTFNIKGFEKKNWYQVAWYRNAFVEGWMGFLNNQGDSSRLDYPRLNNLASKEVEAEAVAYMTTIWQKGYEMASKSYA